MSVPTFVDLQGFILNKQFIVKEAAILRRGFILSHYFFACPVPWSMLIKSERRQASWLTQHHHGLQWEDGNVPYSMAQRVITTAIVGVNEKLQLHEEDEEESSLVYVKGLEKREWLADIVDDAVYGYIIEALDAAYDDIPALNKLDPTYSLRCNKHVKNCALQNVFKLFNWWSQHQKELQDVEK
ncbi:unnamed protein product [Lasius platythorax]|uniref:Uncharacterized protein n=1 Tax=Lasius platythorax TaxID=488582 RepID=A0AAV2P0G7_9HYME